MKIKIYARTYHEAAKLAAQMNLSLRHWQYEGPSEYAALDPWADVGTVMDEYRDMAYEHRKLVNARGVPDHWPDYDR